MCASRHRWCDLAWRCPCVFAVCCAEEACVCGFFDGVVRAGAEVVVEGSVVCAGFGRVLWCGFGMFEC